ncbi:ROK family protein [Endozoicomonas numazuensis]|uniref:Transcriptional regulator n=1 Tax=Endozoicomonas numazuensis TaxID=1137799 RepID=A0A081NLX6_9GAMM|nr:ROK family protein [Endozoicomonas numazuensis]KEQ19449.1 transcriptional regulator [Endozoicomonas numazuensis]
MRLGIDVGGTKTEIVVLSNDGEIIHRKRQPTPGNYPDFIDSIEGLINTVQTHYGLASHIGLCLPGAVSPDTGRMKNANTLYLNDQTVSEDLEHRLGITVKLANDADAFTLSEATDGAAAGARSCFGVIIGTGCGGGLVYNGQLIQGPNAIAGEWGHNVLPYYHENTDGPNQPCYCGRQNCIETFTSGTGMTRRFRENYGYSTKEIPDAQSVMAKVEEGNEQAINHFNHYVDALARALAGVINIFDPEVIVLGGGMSNIQVLYSELPNAVAKYVFSDQLNTRIVQAQHGDSSGVRGAAWL